MNQDLFDLAQEEDFGEIHFKVDAKTGLKAIIAIHDTTLGPALGGCRCLKYPDTQSALKDVLRLARGMSYKAASLGLAHGGGKSVLIRPDIIPDRKAYFQAFARFVDDLNGRYITAVDSGTDVTDMDIINEMTPYVTSTSATSADTSLYTSLGVLRGIQATVRHVFKTDSLDKIHIAIQGMGHVGYLLAKKLIALGAKITACDVNAEVIEACKQELGINVVNPSEIYSVNCDIFAPCALGSILNEKTLSQIKARIIAGSANNQLATPEIGQQLYAKHILYAPDYIINAGGLVFAAGRYDKIPEDKIADKMMLIDKSLTEIFQRSEAENRPCSQIADDIALERLGRK